MKRLGFIVAVVLLCSGQTHNVPFNPRAVAAGGGPTCGAGGVIAEDFDGAATSAANCGSGAGTSTDDIAWDSCPEASGGDIDLDATNLTGDMYTGEEARASAPTNSDSGEARETVSQAELVGYVFVRVTAHGMTGSPDFHRIFVFHGGTWVCEVRTNFGASVPTFELLAGATTSVDTYAATVGTDYIIEMHGLNSGVADECDWRIWECGTSGNIADCPSTPTQTASAAPGNYTTTDIDGVWFGINQAQAPDNSTYDFGEIHVSTGSTWLCS